MDQKTFSGVKREHLAKIRSELGKYGVKIPEGDNVQVDGPLGVKMSVAYSEPESTLTLGIIKKPAFISANQIWKVIEKGAGPLSSKA